MGLDLVEMVMSIEEEFEIDIPDEIAGTFQTPKTVIDHLINFPKYKYRPREYIADKVWKIIETEAGIERKIMMRIPGLWKTWEWIRCVRIIRQV